MLAACTAAGSSVARWQLVGGAGRRAFQPGPSALYCPPAPRASQELSKGGQRSDAFLLTNDGGLSVRAEANGVTCFTARELPTEPEQLAQVGRGGGGDTEDGSQGRVWRRQLQAASPSAAAPPPPHTHTPLLLLLRCCRQCCSHHPTHLLPLALAESVGADGGRSSRADASAAALAAVTEPPAVSGLAAVPSARNGPWVGAAAQR